MLSLTAAGLLAQPLPQYSARQRAALTALGQSYDKVRTPNYQRALALAKRLGRPIEQRLSNGATRILHGVSETGELLYLTTFSTTRQGQTTRTNALYAGGSLGLSLSGSTLGNKLGIWDGGKVRTTHVEFRNSAGASRVTPADGASTLDVHATHVSGTLIAAGVNPAVRGMAYGATLQAWDFGNDLSEMTTAAPNLLVSNHSYGYNAGWIDNPDRTGNITWEWWGDTTVSTTIDYKFGFYDASARQLDQIVYNAPYYLPVFAASNNHGENGPGAGQPYYLGSSNRISYAPRSDQNGYDQIPTDNGAKNILTVAAGGYLANGYNRPADVGLASFSSWGSTDDGRIKPDITGVGLSVLSSSSDSDSAYTTLSGTSMASPNVAGSIVLLQELFSQRNGGKFMRASTLKGLVLHTADEAGSAPGPDYRYGWGLLNMERAGRALLNADKSYAVNENNLAQGATYSLTVVASGRGPLVGTICWTDPAGTATVVSAANLNNRTPKLVNDLDIRISDGTTTTQPWVLDPDNPANTATRGDNIRDNVEQVLIANPLPGQTYVITVTHKGTLSGSSQDYALLLSGIGGQTYCASAAQSSADSKITRVQFGSLNQAGADGCTTYTNFLTTGTTVQAAQTLPLSVSVGTCGAPQNVVVKAFADWNLNGSFDDPGELLATSPVLNGVAQFTAPVTIPTTLTPGQFIRLRIVAQETSDPATVLACGLYAKGETQEYTLQVVQTANDVGPLALVSPQSGICGSTTGPVAVAVQVRNYGTADQTNVSVSVRIADVSNNTLANLTGTVASVAAFSNSQLVLYAPVNVRLTPGQTYSFTITTALATDQNPVNNSLTATVNVAPAPTNGIFAATRCGSDSVVSLRNSGGGTAFWFDAPTGGNLLAAGNLTTAPNRVANGPIYASLNEFAGVIGPTTKNQFSGGSYGQFGPAPIISTQVPLVLDSARLYIGSAGQLTVAITRYDGTILSSTTLNVTPTRTQSVTANANGQYPDDPNDPGAMYALNLRIPAAGEYLLRFGYDANVTIFRSNTAVTGYPFQIRTAAGTPVVSIKGALYQPNATTNDTLRTAWYYVYNLKVRALDCAGPQRVAVPISATGVSVAASISADGSTTFCQGGSVTLRANSGAGLGYQWYRNGVAIGGATSSTLTANTSGSYTVQVSSVCQPVSSSAITVSALSNVAPTITVNSFTLTTNATSGIQWLLNGVPIPGATNPTYPVSQTGRYSVQGSVSGCGVALSNSVYLTILATEPEPTGTDLLVYPNPATRQITVSVTATIASQPPTVRLTDLRGIALRTATMQRDGKLYSTVLDVSDLPGGTFIVIMQDAQRAIIQTKRVRKQ